MKLKQNSFKTVLKLFCLCENETLRPSQPVFLIFTSQFKSKYLVVDVFLFAKPLFQLIGSIKCRLLFESHRLHLLLDGIDRAFSHVSSHSYHAPPNTVMTPSAHTSPFTATNVICNQRTFSSLTAHLKNSHHRRNAISQQPCEIFIGPIFLGLYACDKSEIIKKYFSSI